jgi:acetyl-CoA/propionyl-CoA carboxylase biotin carboxyl carrier protein
VRAETCHGVVESEELAARATELGRTLNHVPLSNGRKVGRVRVVELDGRRFDVRVLEPEPPWRELARRRRERVRAGGGAGTDAVVSPMQGTVLSVAVADGDAVQPGQVICIVEAMKMENEVHAHRAGVVSELSVAEGRPVSTGQVICVITG